MSSQDCDWIDFNLNMPQASRMRGIWEHQICTTHSVLPSLLLEHGRQLDNEALHTLMTEAECIANSCPLTIENLTDRLASKPLTPNHLLILKTQVVLPLPGKFDSPDQYSCKKVAKSLVPCEPALAVLAERILRPPPKVSEMDHTQKKYESGRGGTSLRQ